MRLVADANVLMSALIRRGATLDLLFSEELEVLVPEYLFAEIEDHKEEVRRKADLSEREMELLLAVLSTRVRVVEMDRSAEEWKEAERLSPDPDDVAYFALALKTGCGIWSNDRRLKNQKRVETWTTRELLQGRERTSSG